jgi:hypothetical protein
MTTHPIRALKAQLILLGDVHDPNMVEAIVSAFDGEAALQPTHWGLAGGVRDPFDRSAVLAAVESAGEEGVVPHLIRIGPPFPYDAHWYGDGDEGSVASLHVDAKGQLSQEQAASFFQALGRVAGSIPVDWGHIDVKFEGQASATDMQSSSSADHLRRYARLGPRTLYPRNYFGPRLLAIAEGGEAALRAAGLPVEQLEQGVVQLDLMPEPFMAAPEALKHAQERAHELLRPLGLFIRPINQWDDLPGLQWQSPLPGSCG